MIAAIPAPEPIQAIPAPPPTERVTPPATFLDAIIEDASIKREMDRALADKKLAQTYCSGAGDQGALIIAWGRDFGWQAAQSAMFIDCISGKPALKSVARANLLRKAGYDWKKVKHDTNEATFEFWRNGQIMTNADGTPLILSFTMKQAQTAGYVEKARGKDGKVGNYDKYPENMCMARLMANFHRWYAPEVDGQSLPDPEELRFIDVIDQTEANIAAKSTSALDLLEQQLVGAVKA